MQSQEQLILAQKREQFRVKIRNEKLNAQFNETRRRYLDTVDKDDGNPIVSIREYLIRENGMGFEERAHIVLGSSQLDLALTDNNTLVIMCNLCAVREKANIAHVRELHIANRLLEVGKQLLHIDLKRAHTCIWGLMNFFQMGCERMEAAIIGDINQLIMEGLIDFVVNVHQACQIEGKKTFLVTISELLFNLLWVLMKQEFVAIENILPSQRLGDIFCICLSDLNLFSKSTFDGSLVLQVLQRCVKLDQTLLRRANQDDIINLLNNLDRKQPLIVYHTVKLLLQVTEGSEETQIQRLIYMTMIPDIMKQFHHESLQVRLCAYKRSSTICAFQRQRVLRRLYRAWKCIEK